MGKHLVFVGGGHAHLTALVRLNEYIRRGHRVTLISPSPYQYYSGMAPGMLSGIYRPQEVRFHVKRIAEDRGAEFIPDWVMGINPRERFLSLQSGRKVSYDVVSFNTGSEVPAEKFVSNPGNNIFPVKPVINLLHARNFVIKAPQGSLNRLLVAGGGPAGVEITANLWSLIQEKGSGGKITLIAGKGLLSESPEKARIWSLKFLRDREVEVIEGNHIKEIRKDRVFLQDGRRNNVRCGLSGSWNPAFTDFQGFKSSGGGEGRTPGQFLSAKHGFPGNFRRGRLHCLGRKSSVQGGGLCGSPEPDPLSESHDEFGRRRPSAFRSAKRILGHSEYGQRPRDPLAQEPGMGRETFFSPERLYRSGFHEKVSSFGGAG